MGLVLQENYRTILLPWLGCWPYKMIIPIYEYEARKSRSKLTRRKVSLFLRVTCINSMICLIVLQHSFRTILALLLLSDAFQMTIY
jgi:hypothetical protein